MSRLISSSWLLAVILAMLAGCGGSSESSNGEEPVEEVPAAEDFKRIDPAKLPKLGDHISPEEGVEIAGPAGWNRLPKKPGFVMRYYHKNQSELPRIEVVSGEAPEGFKEVDKGNVAELAEALKAQGRKGVIEPGKPLMLGDSAWVRHVRLAKMSGDTVQVQSLQTVANGKLYTVDLILEGEEATVMNKNKNFGYAVAAGMKFGDAAKDSSSKFQVPMPMPEPAPAPKPEAAPNP